MRISTMLIGADFTPSLEPIYTEDGNELLYITEDDPLYQQHRQHYDKRTGYLCTSLTAAMQDKLTSDLSWYVNYMSLNNMLLSSYMAKYPGKILTSMNLLNIGYIPLGYAPSFVAEIQPLMVRLCELRRVPYIIYRATTMNQQYYKTDTKDVWVHKLDAAKYLGCSPEDVTFPALLGGLLHGN